VATYLFVLNDRPIIHWVLSQRVAPFPDLRRERAAVLREGDSLLLYTTRSAWHNAVRDRGRVVAEVTLTSPLEVLDPPVRIDIRDYSRACDFEPHGLAPFRDGVDLGEYADDMTSFGEKHWKVALRMPLVRLNATDARVLRTPLRRIAVPWDDVVDDYLAASAT
jgi:hypothetical protein